VRQSYFRIRGIPGDRLKLNAAAQDFVAATKAIIRHGGDQAYYTEMGDAIQLPPPDCFTDSESYAATQLHELIHWTKHSCRPDRKREFASWNSSATGCGDGTWVLRR